ncbi:phage portal protein [Laribacter hongkongensis]|uniref:phage portal protein n=1 Tax=Laribacter hongkongensis TaxID=168471 RepID=UPI001EFC4D8D|nr:phage portal protein [Laribacter hongkongensis]MCG8995076.1 phage portal protein [Laribacter hongkongensis]MCG9011187.1 phage portal protein [Laribacter hongkongensis]MCG9023586.1 phage portal protein [Laribacter hongkongensis]MCG9047183.1 phage portal protein [Laribacter hongkongensis]MCG9074619.1 phage portal protein [Laribacter hongkongensis]
MTRRRRRPAADHAAPPAIPAAPAGTGCITFTFGDPESVLDRREILDYAECLTNGRWYEPPLSWDGLSRSWRAAVHHASAIAVKRNLLTRTFVPHPLMDRATFGRWVLDYLIFGNGYLEAPRSRLGNWMPVRHALAKYVRRGTDMESFWWVTGYGQEHAFPAGSVFQLMEPDIHQEVYGLPEYLAALNSAWLNESATLFRRRYYANGSHAGFILYLSDPAAKEEDVNAMRKALQSSKGLGNFKNLFMHSPNGKKDGLQLIPISEVAAKDEFFNIKNVTRDDVLAAHRVPPQLMGIIPTNTGGFGDASTAAQVFYRNEIEPLQSRLMELNDWLGIEVVRFSPYLPEAAA